MSAADLARDAAKALGGGTAKHADVVQGGGQNVDAVDDALALSAVGGAGRRRVSRPGTRILGVDLGERRIGLAVTDPSGVLASPHSTLTRAADRADDHRAIVAAATELGGDVHRGRSAPLALG